ncbi:uncharacterized protein BXIN_1537 [Babesia sp. Xinjiang]|uniref:uncharacterized protein n=1 Tax=Babesia sp. Xinjiang TaxID=462227 RepID=UPI000A21B296|nr:uncharacterized protein BXIN_1537 [Babesia sp. Xinjiang]ORM42297.1 hypothetical protein BXIN_1537 [Babesia sp. Xinjiang]
MSTYILSLPNGITRCVTVDYSMLLQCVDSEDELFTHWCMPGDLCRRSIPCLSGTVCHALVENVFGVGLGTCRLDVRGGNTLRYIEPGEDMLDSTASAHATPTDCGSFFPEDIDTSLYRATRCNALKDGVAMKFSLRLLGGKGGFGALLKRKGNRKRQSSNIDSCRTLTGERIRQSRLNELSERQNANTVDPAATKLPLPKEQPEQPTSTATLEHLKKVKKEAKRVKNTVAKGLQNALSSSGDPKADGDEQQRLEKALNECMDIYSLV